MNRFVLILFCFLYVVFAGFRVQSDSPEKLLTDSRDYLLSLKDFSAKFSYKLEAIQSKKIAYNGILKYKKGNYRLTLNEHDIFFDGMNHTIYLPEENQYQKLEENPSYKVNLVKYMTYVYTWPSQKKYLGEENLNGVPHYKVELNMTDENTPYEKAVLWMDKDNKLIMKVSFVDSKKTITTYEFTEINLNIGLKKSDFIFDPNSYPGATEIDED
jgi:outer membrane lipoprotein-sorting protein